jgi:hypothetical protein
VNLIDIVFVRLPLQPAEPVKQLPKNGYGQGLLKCHPRASSRRKRTRSLTKRTLYGAVSRQHRNQSHDSTDILAVQDCPKGYPLLAAFLDSDDNFMIYRRFGYLQARLLLEKQEQLRRLEWELEVLDENDKQASSRDLITFADNEDGNVQERQQLMQRIEEKFRDYGTSRRFLFHRNSLTCQSASLLQVAESLVRCNRPSSGEHCSVRNFINYRQPLVPSEQRFINCKEDLITLRPGREHAWLDSSVEKALKWLRCDLIEVSDLQVFQH